MSDIMKRTIFYDNSDGVVRFHDWALVLTELGEMMEPFQGIATKWQPNTVAGLVNFDATEPGCRIDEIKSHSLDKGLQLYGDTVTGGVLMPRKGR